MIENAVGLVAHGRIGENFAQLVVEIAPFAVKLAQFIHNCDQFGIDVLMATRGPL